MIELSGQPGEFHFTIEVKRAETGKTEQFKLIGKVADDGGNTLDGSSQRRD